MRIDDYLKVKYNKKYIQPESKPKSKLKFKPDYWNWGTQREWAEKHFGREWVEKEKQKKHSRYISNKVRTEVWNRDRGQCVKCGSQTNLEFDHIIPFIKGGSSSVNNIQLLCQECNRKKHGKI
ncbi:MAG: HNH endonuclease [Candidatus Hodarchaeota archaeon]